MTHELHAAYFTELLTRWQPGAEEERHFRAAIQSEIENVGAAWTWALAADQVVLLIPAVEGLFQFYDLVCFYHEAEATFGRSVTHLRTLIAQTAEPQPAHQQLLAILLVKLSYFYSYIFSLPQQAIPRAEEGIELALRLGDVRSLVTGYWALGMAAYAQTNYSRQLELLEKALALAETHGLHREQVNCLNGLGICGTHLHHYDAALTFLHRGVDLAQQINDSRMAITLQLSLGVTYRDMGDFIRAIECFEQTLHPADEISTDLQIGFATANLGLLRLLLGDYEPAHAHLEESRQLFVQLGARMLVAEIQVTIGKLLEQRGDRAAAAACCREVLAVAEVHHYVEAQQIAWLTLGNLHLHEKEYDAAYAAYTRVIELSQGHDTVAHVLQLAAVLLAQKRSAEAQAEVEEVLHKFDPADFASYQSPQQLLLACYPVLAANSDPRAEAVLQQAWDLLQKQAAKIREPGLHHSFMVNVPFNRELKAEIKLLYRVIICAIAPVLSVECQTFYLDFINLFLYLLRLLGKRK
jgi:tetratricopeptide (TPR) repeat protein